MRLGVTASRSIHDAAAAAAVARADRVPRGGRRAAGRQGQPAAERARSSSCSWCSQIDPARFDPGPCRQRHRDRAVRRVSSRRRLASADRPACSRPRSAGGRPRGGAVQHAAADLTRQAVWGGVRRGAPTWMTTRQASSSIPRTCSNPGRFDLRTLNEPIDDEASRQPTTRRA